MELHGQSRNGQQADKERAETGMPAPQRLNGGDNGSRNAPRNKLES